MRKTERLKAFEFNTHVRYDVADSIAKGNEQLHKSMRATGDPCAALAAALIESGSGSCFEISNKWQDPTKGFVAREKALKFGEIFLKENPKVAVLKESKVAEINYKSHIQYVSDKYAFERAPTDEVFKDLKGVSADA